MQRPMRRHDLRRPAVNAVRDGSSAGRCPRAERCAMRFVVPLLPPGWRVSNRRSYEITAYDVASGKETLSTKRRRYNGGMYALSLLDLETSSAAVCARTSPPSWATDRATSAARTSAAGRARS